MNQRKFKWFRILTPEELLSFPNYSLRMVQVNHRNYCIARKVNNILALDDRCPHAGGRLSMGKCDEHGNVICPIHRYRYDLVTGKGLQGDYVNSFPVEIRNDGVYLGIKKRWWQLF